MIEKTFSNFIELNLTGIIIYALLSFMIIRLIVSLWTYKSAMDQLKQSMSVIIFLVVAIVYVVSPIDLIPDILLVIGWIDDAIILLGSIAFANEAARKIFWGDLPKEKRFKNFITWYLYCLLGCFAVALLFYYN